MIYILYKEVGVRPHTFVLDKLVVAVDTTIPIMGKMRMEVRTLEK